MKKVKVIITSEQKEFLKIKRFVQKKFPGAYVIARHNGTRFQIVDENGFSVIDPELRIPLAKTVRQAWEYAKYGAWFGNMIRKSNAAFSDEKIYKKLAKEHGDE